MNYIEKVQNKLSPKTDLSKDEDALLDLYTLLAIVKGDETTMEDIHDAWSIWMNRKDKKHRSLIPFKELPEHVQEYDRPYMEAVHDTAS